MIVRLTEKSALPSGSPRPAAVLNNSQILLLPQIARCAKLTPARFGTPIAFRGGVAAATQLKDGLKHDQSPNSRPALRERRPPNGIGVSHGDPRPRARVLAADCAAPGGTGEHAPRPAAALAPHAVAVAARVPLVPGVRRPGDVRDDLRAKQLLGLERNDLLADGRRGDGRPGPGRAGRL